MYSMLSLVPPGTVIVAEVTYGAEPSLLELTRKNTADLTRIGISGISELLQVIASQGKAIRNLRGILCFAFSNQQRECLLLVPQFSAVSSSPGSDEEPRTRHVLFRWWPLTPFRTR